MLYYNHLSAFILSNCIAMTMHTYSISLTIKLKILMISNWPAKYTYSFTQLVSCITHQVGGIQIFYLCNERKPSNNFFIWYHRKIFNKLSYLIITRHTFFNYSSRFTKMRDNVPLVLHTAFSFIFFL